MQKRQGYWLAPEESDLNELLRGCIRRGLLLARVAVKMHPSRPQAGPPSGGGLGRHRRGVQVDGVAERSHAADEAAFDGLVVARVEVRAAEIGVRARVVQQVPHADQHAVAESFFATLERARRHSSWLS